MGNFVIEKHGGTGKPVLIFQTSVHVKSVLTTQEYVGHVVQVHGRFFLGGSTPFTYVPTSKLVNIY